MYRKRVYFREKGAKCKSYRKSANFTKINVKNFANFTEKVLHLQTKSVQKMKKKVNCLYGPTYDYVICVTLPICTYHFGECPQKWNIKGENWF